MRSHRIFWLLLICLPLLIISYTATSARDTNPVIVVLRLQGTLHPAMLEHMERAIKIADNENAGAIVIELDTPGGSVDIMNKLVEQIRSSDTPIIVYVSPRGAMAASAGTLITLSGHLSAMAPETTIGAASPVDSEGNDVGETMESKIKEILKASVRTLAASRPPEARNLAEDMIQNARAVSVDEALEIGLIDFKANDLDDLLEQANHIEITINDQSIQLQTGHASIKVVNKTFMEELLMVLANANIAFLLLSIGVQAILIEISSPGGWIAGFIGTVCLLLAVYGMGLLPVNWFGALFLVVAFVLFILDIKAPTHGALTAAGVGAFITGALVLFNSPSVPSFQRVSVPLVVGVGIFTGILFFTIIGFALRAQRTPQHMDKAAIIGQTGFVNTPLSPNGTVLLGSELWTAYLEDDTQRAQTGERVKVIGIDRLKIIVKKVDG